MINTELVLLIIVSYLILFIFVRVRYKNKSYYPKIMFSLFISLNLFIIIVMIANIHYANVLYTNNVLEAPKGMIEKVLTENIKMVSLLFLFNLLYALDYTFKK